MIEIEKVENGFIVVVKPEDDHSGLNWIRYVFPNYAEAERFVRKHFGEGE